MGLFTKMREARQKRLETRMNAKVQVAQAKSTANAVAYASGVVPQSGLDKVVSVVGGIAESVSSIFGGTKVGSIAESVSGILNKGSSSTVSNDNETIIAQRDNTMMYVIGGAVLIGALFFLVKKR